MYDLVERMEIGPWFEATRLLDGEQAWRALQRFHDAGPPRPYCVYVHVPFCARICSFCALYTRAVRADADAVFDEYLDCVSRSLDVHPAAASGRAPETVHFGGGTPLHLGLPRFLRLLGRIRGAFGDAPKCEWALETTTSSLNTETTRALADARVARIHLGIQTLNDGIRTRTGRTEDGATALERIERLFADGFDVSVDLIIGFEETTEAVVARDLELLHAAGVRMFSVCALRERRSMVRGPEERRRRAAVDHGCWRELWQFMAAHGLMPIHIGQFGVSQRDNLYFTHPARGEDCVALGPYAHGAAGRLYTANLLQPDYYDAIRSGAPPLRSGILYDDTSEEIRGLERELLSHSVDRATLDRVAAVCPASFPNLALRWQEAGLLVSSEGRFRLSCDGSWFVGNMVADARRMTQREWVQPGAAHSDQVNGTARSGNTRLEMVS